ncbi:hypothetical protein O3S68_16560 [Kosakonia sp. SOY2]|uniref:hypothetical protein n=1 Tax=Kosakonia sp. SOY2 TaxID=3014557 RepID=UPI0022AC5A38|nr:hypothetical protein [Kosakonia sp. SOY2]MCZ3383896.1 hypothetical protein [Kosakonia sp. SOY2]
MKSVTVGSAIVGGALIVASFINSGQFTFKDEHIIPVTGGTVKLGEVYDEHQIVSLKMSFNDKDFEDEQLLQQSNAGDYKDALKDKLRTLSDLVNAGNKSQEKATADSISLKKPARLEINMAVKYRSEYQPSFTLVIGTKTVDLPANTAIYQASVDAVDSFMKEKKMALDSSLYLK